MIALIEIPEELYHMMVRGDARCRFPLGSKVVRNTNVESKDGTLITPGTKGVIKGSIWKPIPDWTPWGLEHEAYLVKFETRRDWMICIGLKLSLI